MRSQSMQSAHVFAQEGPKTRIPYAGLAYDQDKLINLVDRALEFWLTARRYTEQFEQNLADFLQVKY